MTVARDTTSARFHRSSRRYDGVVNVTRLLVLVLALAAVACGPSKPSASADSAGGADPPASGSGGDGETPPAEMAGIVEAHNAHRAKHCAPPLQWSAELARTAQSWADHLAKKGCSLEHSSTPFGENLAAATAVSPAGAADLWYREIQKYDFKKGTFSMHTGHFTQVVWVGSRRLGCGTATCKDRQLWVCNYDPPGNMEGDFKRNVLPTSCKR